MTHMAIMTGEDRWRKWGRAEREQILAAAFAPGAGVAQVARQFDVASSLIYTWRRQAAGGAARKRSCFSPAILIEQVPPPVPMAPPMLPSEPAVEDIAAGEPAAITVELPSGARVVIGATAPPRLWPRRRCGRCNDPCSNGGQNLDCHWPHGHAARHAWAGFASTGRLRRDPFGGDVFVFRGRSGALIKEIWHDGLGLSLYAKRLDPGQFVWPQTMDGAVALTAAQMSYLLEAIDWRNPQHTWRPQSAG